MHTSGGTCICRDTGMCIIFGVAPGFWVPFLAIPGFLGIMFLAIPRFLGITVWKKFDFFRNNSDFDISINDIVECCLQGSCFYDSTVLASVLLCLCKVFHVVYNSCQFEFVYL